MNKFFLTLLIVISFGAINKPEKVIARQGQVSFFSYTSVENIKAENNQVTAGFSGLSMHAIKLTPEKHYDWHFDNCDWDFETKKINYSHGRYWTHLIYLTDGAHLELGALNIDKKVAVETKWSAPPTDKIIAKIYPEPGKSIIFPSFMAHRVHPHITKDRWTLSEFITRVDYEGFTQETYDKAKELYYNEYTRRFGISP